jgi:hypothetical protein
VMVLTYSSEVNLYTQNTPIVKAEVVVPAHTISVERAKQSILPLFRQQSVSQRPLWLPLLLHLHKFFRRPSG